MIRFFKFLFGLGTSSKKLQDLLEKGAIVIDVRTPREFNENHTENSINILLQKLTTQLEVLKQKRMPVILCCRNGARSFFAQTELEKAGIECMNAGSWKNLKNLS